MKHACVAIVMASLIAGIYFSLYGIIAERRSLPFYFRGDVWHWIGVVSCLVLSVHLMLLTAQMLRRKPIRLFAVHVRSLFILLVTCWAYSIFLMRPYDPYHVHVLLGSSIALFAAGCMATPLLQGGSSTRVLRITDLLLTNICVAAVGAELALGLLASMIDAPIFSRPVNSVSEMIATYRFPAGQKLYGFHINSTGHYDTEFRPGGNDQVVYATIGDSFSVGIVPHAYHFTTIAEKGLGDAEVYNFGFPAIGPREYLYLLEHEVLPLRPQAVVINLFVGNDILQAGSEAVRHPLLSSWFNHENALLALVPARLWKIQREQERLGREASGSPESVLGEYPWLADPAKERKTHSDEGFLDLEAARARVGWAARSTPHYETLFSVLRRIADLSGDTPIGVLLIPDCFQIQDDLWEQIQHRVTDRELERDLAQRRIGDWLEKNGIPYLDLLPHMRAVAPMADGRRHLYHANDTHINVRGNALVGELLAEFITRLVKDRRPK